MSKFVVTKNEAGKRADVFVAMKLPEFTRSSLSGLFEKNLVLINGAVAKASHKLKDGDKLEVDTSLLTARPADIELPIVYEDDDVIVINKPAGVLTHSKGLLNTEATVASFIRPKLVGADTTNNRAGIVHRLDRATSGVIITAKNDKALKWLQKQFSTRKTDKTYLAVVEGVPSPEKAIIDAPIERNPKKPQTFHVGVGGRPSQTRYKVLRKLNPSTTLRAGRSYSLLELRPLTGRTHQLRVHLKYIGHPIVGDRVYGHDGENMYLHAKSLEVTLPGGKRVKFEAPEPNFFNEFTK